MWFIKVCIKTLLYCFKFFFKLLHRIQQGKATLVFPFFQAHLTKVQLDYRLLWYLYCDLLWWYQNGLVSGPQRQSGRSISDSKQGPQGGHCHCTTKLCTNSWKVGVISETNHRCRLAVHICGSSGPVSLSSWFLWSPLSTAKPKMVSVGHLSTCNICSCLEG